MWDFHKETTKAEESDIEVQWYEKILSIKKKLKKEGQIKAKQKGTGKAEVRK